MRICIIGQGFVGKATALTLKHQPEWHDPPKGLITDYKSADVIFVCCFDDALDFYLNELKDHPCVIIRTTLIPSKVKDTNFAVYPEFLVEKKWQEDAIKPIQIIFGGTEKQFDMLKNISNLNMSNAVKTTNDISALMKVSTNAFLSTKVLFLNLIYKLCVENKINYDEFKDVIKVDNRLGHTHFDVPGPDGQLGFGGKCFPKDATLLKNLFETSSKEYQFFDLMLNVNKELRK